MDEIQGYLIAYLAKAIEHLQGAPEEGSGTTGTGRVHAAERGMYWVRWWEDTRAAPDYEGELT